MIEIGTFNRLVVLRNLNPGIYLDGGRHGDIPLKLEDEPVDCKIGSQLRVFVYHDARSQLAATTKEPLTSVGRCELLRVVHVNSVGAFLDWGLEKDLLVPHREQQTPMMVGHSYVVYTYFNRKSARVVASTKLSRHLIETTNHFKVGDEVQLQVAVVTDLGYKAVIDDRYLGMIFSQDAFRALGIGERLIGYVKSVRDDGKIDLIISRASKRNTEDLGEKILQHLLASGGTSTLSDKSPPDVIYQQFKVSKKKYKQALGTLYRNRRIEITPGRIRLIK